MISELVWTSVLLGSSVPQPTYWTYQATTNYAVSLVCPISTERMDYWQNKYGVEYGVYNTQVLDNLITGELDDNTYYQITMYSYLDYRDSTPSEEILNGYILDGSISSYEKLTYREKDINDSYATDEEFEINFKTTATFKFEDARKIYNEKGNVYFHFDAFIECTDMMYNNGLRIDSGTIHTALSTGDYTTGYAEGYDNGYNGGYNIGYNNGYQEGYDYSEDLDDYSVQSMLTTILDYPLKLVKQVTNVELFGVNLYSVITFVISISLVAFAIKYFI